MALTVQANSQTVTLGAESYISVADADTYWTAHGSPVAWTDATTAQKEAALRYATAYLDGNWDWIGYRSTDDLNRLEWPRENSFEGDRTWTGVPQPLRDACCELALGHLATALNVKLSRANKIKEIKTPDVGIVYLDSAPAAEIYRYVENLLRFIGVSTSAGTIRVRTA